MMGWKAEGNGELPTASPAGVIVDVRSANGRQEGPFAERTSTITPAAGSKPDIATAAAFVTFRVSLSRPQGADT